MCRAENAYEAFGGMSTILPLRSLAFSLRCTMAENNNNTVAVAEKPPQKIHSQEEDKDKNTLYNVVIDIEERFSIWPKEQRIPPYWKGEGFNGTKQECLDYIQRVWTDMRPLSLKKEMAKHEAE